MSAFKLASAVHEPVAGPSHGGTPAATQPALHADVLIKIAQAAGLDTFSKFLRANRDARAALDRPSVWRDVLVAEFGANRALLELLFRVLGRASNAAETSLFVSIRAESGSSLLRVLADQLRMLPVPPAAAHFVAKRLGQLKQAKELRTVQASFSRGASQLPASDARDALLAFAQQLADALPTSSNDGPIFLSILRAAPALPYNITKSHLASFLESTRFPVCPTSVFDSLRIHGTLHALSGSDVVLSLLEVVFQAWRDADQTLLSLLHASGLRIKDFAGSQTKSRYLSPLDAWFASAVKRVIASVSIQVPPSESKISTAEALSSSRLVAFSRFCARQGARLDSRGLSLDLIPAAIEAFASLSPSQRVTEFLVFRAFLADVIPSQSESNECDEIGAELFAAHLKSLPRQQSEPVDLSAATLFFDSGLLDPEIAMDLLKEHAESLIPPAGREAGDSLNVPFLGPRRMDPKVEESFAQMGTLSPRLQNVLALGKPIEKRIGDVAGFGKWLLGRCLEKEDLVGIVTCLKSGVEVGRKEVEIVWGRGVAGQQRIWPLLLRHSAPSALSRLACLLPTAPRTAQPDFSTPSKRRIVSLPSSPAIKPREPEELLADLVLHGIRTKFETVVRSAIVRSLKSGHGVPPLKDLLMGVVGWEGGADFSVWDEDEDETIGESLVESDLEMDALPEETEGPAEDAGPWQPATLPGEGGVQFAQAWFTGDVDF